MTMYVTGTYDVILMLSLIFIIIKTGAEVNDNFEIFKGIFIKHKQYFWELKSRNVAIKSAQGAKLKTFKIFGDMFKCMNISDQAREKYIDGCIVFLEMAIQRIDHDKHNSPLTIMGMITSHELIKTIYTAVISVTFALTQFIYQKFR